MKILITGGTGFIGSHLTADLASRGHDVCLIMRESSSAGFLSGRQDQVSLFRTKGGYSALESILKDFQPDIVIHLASLFLSQHRPDDVEKLIHSNILFSSQLLEAMHTCNIRRMINTGTSWQHYEDASYNPVNLYSATKQAFEAICEYYCRALDFKIISLKLFDTYGPEDSRNKIIPLLINAIGKKNTLRLSPGEQKLDIVHIQDICRAYNTAISQIESMHAKSHISHGISSGSHISLKKLVQLIEEISGEKLPIIWGGQPYRQREVYHPWSNFNPLPGWEPEIAIEDGLKQLIKGVNLGIKI